MARSSIQDKRTFLNNREALLYGKCMIDVQRLRTFRSVVATGGVHAAAETLGYSPSAVSQQVAALQRETGLQLIEREGRGIRITAAGLALAEGGGAVLDSMQRLVSLTQELRQGVEGGLQISTFASFAQACLPSALGRLGVEFPKIVVNLDIQEVRRSSPAMPVDLAVQTEDPLHPPREHEGFTRIALGEEPYFAVVGRMHPFAKRDAITMAELEGEPLINSSSDEVICGEIVTRACHAAGVTPRFTVQTGDHTTALAMAAAGLGCAVLPRLSLHQMREDIAVVPLDDPQPKRRIALFVRDMPPQNPALSALVALLQPGSIDSLGPGAAAVSP